jgi:hypothetical protein
MTISIAAFGALNNDSYDVFADRIAHYADVFDLPVSLISAGPYPNARGESEPDRPLRAEALQDEARRQALYAAVAEDARKIGGLRNDILVMPCMSMIGFHDGVEQALGRQILRLADALAAKYRHVPQLGVIHMRPAKQRIEEIFGDKAVTPNERQAAALLAAEEEVKKRKTPFPVYDAMKEITEAWRDKGIKHVLFARADAPKAHLSSAGMVDDIVVNTYFDILAEATLKLAKEMSKTAPSG